MELHILYNPGEKGDCMKAIASLLTEHRLIEQILQAVRCQIRLIEVRKPVNARAIDGIIDFLATYADRTHHGKEEEILFKALETRELQTRDRACMNKLKQDHAFLRRTILDLSANRNECMRDDACAASDVFNTFRQLLVFYPVHVACEEEVFFTVAARYFTTEEQAQLVTEFNAFDQQMIHEKYRQLAECLSLSGIDHFH
jgi:hemerythrin-like domain-containing protein